MSLLKINESINAKLNIHYVETWKKVGVSLTIALGIIVILGGVLAYLSHNGIFRIKSFDFLNAFHSNGINALMGAGGGITLLAIVIASILRYRTYLFKKRFDANLSNERKEQIAACYQKIIGSLKLSTPPLPRGMYSQLYMDVYLLVIPPSSDFLGYKYSIEYFKTSSSFQKKLDEWTKKNNYSLLEQE